MSGSQNLPTRRRYAVVGGGISGLAATYRLTRLVPSAEIELFEASDRLGGVLQTNREGSLLVERGADSFINKLPWAVDLCRELGLADQLILTNESERRALVLRDGKLHPVPAGFVVMKPHRFMTLLQSPLLNWRGKLRVLAEGWIPRGSGVDDPNYDESVASFATRRLGREVFERLVQPLLAGIYTADPYRLSLAATMPEVLEAERKHGSLRAALRAIARNHQPTADAGARYASFVTLKEGVGQLVGTLAKKLEDVSVHRRCPLESLAKADGSRWSVVLANGSRRDPFDGIILAMPAPRAALLVENIDQSLAEQLKQIPYASSAIVSLAYRCDQIGTRPRGFGFVVPTIERRQIMAASFSSLKFEGRAPDDQLLVRVFLGGAMQAEQMDWSDDRLCAVAQSELGEILKISGDPSYVDLVRWQEKMPQYHVGHVARVDAIESRTANHAGLELAGNAYRGVGIPQCVRSGDAAARRLVESTT